MAIAEALQDPAPVMAERREHRRVVTPEESHRRPLAARSGKGGKSRDVREHDGHGPLRRGHGREEARQPLDLGAAVDEHRCYNTRRPPDVKFHIGGG